MTASFEDNGYELIWKRKRNDTQIKTDNIQNIDTMFQTVTSLSGDSSKWNLKNIKPLKEKLNIQPISRERLRNHIVHYNSAMDMRANFKTGDFALIGKPNTKHIGVYISKEDIENETYDKYFGFAIALRDTRFYKDGVFIIFYKHAPYDAGKETFTRTDLAQLDSNLTQNGKDYCIWVVWRFVNLKLPLDVEYFKEQPIYKAVKIWER
jgi:hypothetical protein